MMMLCIQKEINYLQAKKTSIWNGLTFAVAGIILLNHMLRDDIISGGGVYVLTVKEVSNSFWGKF